MQQTNAYIVSCFFYFFPCKHDSSTQRWPNVISDIVDGGLTEDY